MQQKLGYFDISLSVQDHRIVCSAKIAYLKEEMGHLEGEMVHLAFCKVKMDYIDIALSIQDRMIVPSAKMAHLKGVMAHLEEKMVHLKGE